MSKVAVLGSSCSCSADDLLAQRQAILDHGGQARDPWAWEGTDFCECTDPDGNVVQVFGRAQP